MSLKSLLDSNIPIIDTDSHVIEPYDLWTSRVSTKKWGDKVPHVRWDTNTQLDSWFFGDERVDSAAGAALAGYEKYSPDYPPSLDDVSPENWKAPDRLNWMDRVGVHAQILYPNIVGFGGGKLFALNEPELMLACCRAYNDFLTDFASIAPDRYIAVTALPFWDLDLTIAEMERCAAKGHRGVIMSREPEFFGMPHLVNPYWERLWAAAQDMELSINFHIAAGNRDAGRFAKQEGVGPHATISGSSITFFLANAKVISDIVHAGIAHRYPSLKFVSVESGVGWIPFVLQSMDWHWKGCGVQVENPQYDLLPSEYFKRQFYGCFWFEDATALHAIDVLGPDCILFETDFPHPTCLSPGPASPAPLPRDHLLANFAHLPDETMKKILHDNAAKLYHLG